jgi:hypothetical protein
MTVSLRLEVLKNLTELLEEITPVNGFDNDLSGAVFRGRMVFGEDDPLPMVSILEAPMPKDQTPSPKGSCSNVGPWELIIQGFVEDDHENPTDPGHILMEEVKIKLRETRSRDGGFNILGFGGVVTDLQIGPGVVRPPDQQSSRAYFWLSIILTLAE